MSWFDKFQSLFLLAAMVVGLVLGQIAAIAARASWLITPALVLLLVGVFLHIPFRDFALGLRNARFTGLNLALNFVWTPVFAWALGAVFLRDQPDLWVGLIMLLVTPCTDWYLVFTNVARGNVALASTQLPWHLGLQLVLLPVYLFLFAGTLVPVDVRALLDSLALVLVLPLTVATILRFVTTRLRGPGWLDRTWLPRVAQLQVLLLCVAVAAMFASQGRLLLDEIDLVVKLMPPLALFYLSSFLLARACSRLARFDTPTSIGLCFATLARNSPMSLAIAVTVFPDRPVIALALAIEPLVELPVLAATAQILKRRGAERVAGRAAPS